MRWILAVVSFALLIPGTSLAAGSHVARIREAGELVMLCFPQQDNPFAFVRTEAGPMPEVGGMDHFGGIDVEILAHVAEELEVALRIRPIPRPSVDLVFTMLFEDDGDLGGGGLTITEARSKRVTFSVPYVAVYEAVIVRQGSPIRGVADLEGKHAAILSGSSHHEVLERRGFDRARIRLTDFTIEALVAVQGGEADFTLLDAFGPGASVDLPRDLTRAFVLPEEVGGIGLAIRPESDLVPVIDRVIGRLRESGTLAEIIERHKTW